MTLRNLIAYCIEHEIDLDVPVGFSHPEWPATTHPGILKLHWNFICLYLDHDPNSYAQFSETEKAFKEDMGIA